MLLAVPGINVNMQNKVSKYIHLNLKEIFYNAMNGTVIRFRMARRHCILQKMK